MKFDFNKFSSELYAQFQDSFSLDEVHELLKLDESYSKDNPASTGKTLVINHLTFKGEKDSGEIIDYSQKVETGINIWIADSFKGKSSILKIIKFALTGDNSLKVTDIKKWVKEILLNFSIGNKKYTIYLNTEKRLKAEFYNCKISTWQELEDNEKSPIFISKSEIEYTEQIQDFFFTQFSYYSLKWTQKNSQKESNDLSEAETSWKTYYKSIFLESKDSYQLIYEGHQGAKVFQMLLGLELTYPINQLTIKKDFIRDEKGKNMFVTEVNAKEQSKHKVTLSKELEDVKKELDKLNKASLSQSDIGSLNEKEALLRKGYKEEWEKQNAYSNTMRELDDKLDKIQKRGTIKNSDISKAAKELEKNQKKILDLKDYLQIGIFFSNLDIKHCPSCNHTIEETKKKEKLAVHKCALCDESVSGDNDVSDTEDYSEKIESLENHNKQLAIFIKESETEREVLRNDYTETKALKATTEKQKASFKDLTHLLNQLKVIQNSIKIELAKTPLDTAEKDKLIAREAVIEFQINEINKKKAKPSTINYDNKIAFLSAAIDKLNRMRYDLGKVILSKLAAIMLNEIQEFGLNSITEISISERLDIIYKQNDTPITFKDITEGEQLRAKLAFYLSLIQLDIELNVGRHTRFLMIDSPNKEEGDAEYLEGLSNVLRSIQSRFGEHLQILIGTAERAFTDVIENQYVTPERTFIF